MTCLAKGRSIWSHHYDGPACVLRCLYQVFTPDSVESRWVASHVGSPTNYRKELFRRLNLSVGYEACRQMLDGTSPPREDVMEAAAALFGLDPQEFPEYRIWQIEQVLNEHPDARTGSTI